MAQLHRLQKNSESPKTPRPQHSPTFGQLLQGEPSSPAISFSPTQGRHHDQHEDINHHNKKSVLAKVKERARKLRYSLSGRRRHGSGNHDNNTTPPWGVSLHDDEEDDEDPEYLGAPMYESELAPEDYKEAARQHPREVRNVKNQQPSANCTKAKVHFEENTASSSKSINQTMSEKLAPSSSEAVSDETKLPGLKFTDPKEQETKSRNGEPIAGPGVNSIKNLEKCSEKTERSSNSPQKWDKGVSVKEYFIQKFEPGEDERALSHVISEAISPRKNSSNGIGVVGKVKEAVSSFLWPEEPSRLATRALNSSSHNALSTVENAAPQNSNLTINTIKSQEVPISNSTNSSPLAMPISTHVQEEIEEQNHGRILQAN